jgi:hypothetical protein
VKKLFLNESVLHGSTYGTDRCIDGEYGFFCGFCFISQTLLVKVLSHVCLLEYVTFTLGENHVKKILLNEIGAHGST